MCLQGGEIHWDMKIKGSLGCRDHEMVEFRMVELDQKLTDQAQRVRSVTSNVAQGSIPGPFLFNTFNNNLDDRQNRTSQSLFKTQKWSK